MYKRILAVVTVLSLSQTAFANNSQANGNDIWQCVDSKTLQAENTCVADTMGKNIDNQAFFNQLANKDFSTKRDVFATVTYFPKRQLIEVKSIEFKTPEPAPLLVAKR